jgi:hypothetical protein
MGIWTYGLVRARAELVKKCGVGERKHANSYFCIVFESKFRHGLRKGEGESAKKLLATRRNG